MKVALFPEKLRRARKLRRLTQEQAAEACELSPRYWGKLECGLAIPSLITLAKISKGLNAEISVCESVEISLLPAREEGTQNAG